MAALTDPQKLFVVRALAQFQKPTEVVNAFKAEFGLDIPPQQVEAYDPGKHAGRKLSKKWRLIFDATRKSYLEDVSSIPLAHRGYRLATLQRLLDKAMEQGRGGNVPLAQSILIEAEKISGDMYTNRRIVQVDPRSALAELLGVSPDEIPDGDGDAQ